MAALAADRKDLVNYAPMLKVCQHVPVLANTVLYLGALVCRNADGFGVPGSVSATLRALGVCYGDQTHASVSVNNTGGANGAVFARVESGIYKFKNSTGADLIVIADVGNDCFILDDQTVAKTSATNARSVAGKVVQVDTDGVLVLVGPGAW